MGILAVGKGAVSKGETGKEVNSELRQRFCKKVYIGGANNNVKEE